MESSKKALLCLLFFFFTTLQAYTLSAAVSINFVLNGRDIERDKYKTDLIKMILDRAKIDYELYYYKKPGGHDQNVERLKKGIVTIQSFGATKFLEETLIPIRIPIFKGLIGYRVFLINKNDQHKFNKIKELDQLRKLTGMQGKGWTDIKILNDAGLPQLVVPSFALYRILNRGGRADYFSRAVYEAVGELQTLKNEYPDITLEKRILLTYPFALYFYVSPKYPDLAKKLTEGFQELVDCGKFENFFYHHSYIRSAIEKTHLDTRIKFHIPNHYLSKETRNLPSRYWFNMSKFLEYNKKAK